jgi:hypothetical protein
MPEDRGGHRRGDDAQDEIKARFPDLPVNSDVPEVPRLDSTSQPVKDVTNIGRSDVPEVPRLAPVVRPVKPGPQRPAIEPGSYNKAALASTAATSFIMPTIVFALIGYFLDQKLHTNYLAFIGVVVGLIVGISALMRIVKRLE